MRGMVRNKTTFWFALYKGQEELIDEHGNATGQYSVTYGEPVEAYGNISAAQGAVKSREFGSNVVYDKVIVLDDTSTPIDEYAILWVDSVPELTESGQLALRDDGTVKTPHDYLVSKVAPSLNSVSIAISKVVVR